MRFTINISQPIKRKPLMWIINCKLYVYDVRIAVEFESLDALKQLTISDTLCGNYLAGSDNNC